jgi:hypothetical protein
MKARTKLLQWDQLMICREFGMDSRTVAKRLAAVDLGEKSRWNTGEVCKAMFGNMAGERLRLVKEQADKLALENETRRETLVPVADLVQRLGKYLSAARARIDGDPKLDRDEKDKIITDLGQMLSVLRGTRAGPAPADDVSAEADR